MPTKPRYTWDPIAARYRGRDGRFIPDTQIRAAIDRAIRQSNREVREIAEQLRRGTITLDEWAMTMREQIKAQQLAAATVARGGAKQMSQSDYGRVGGNVANQFRFLNSFEKQIAAGLPLDGRFKARVELYSEAARTTFEATKRDVVSESGAEEERSILGIADHCEECAMLAAMGWQPIGSSPPPGQRQCGNKCKCRMQFR
jgi:hypothetical protein